MLNDHLNIMYFLQLPSIHLALPYEYSELYSQTLVQFSAFVLGHRFRQMKLSLNPASKISCWNVTQLKKKFSELAVQIINSCLYKKMKNILYVQIDNGLEP